MSFQCCKLCGKKRLPDLTIEYAFPIRGHSFLPADRVFGRIEQQIRKNNSVLHPEEYYELLREHGNVYVYDIDWQAFDFKSQTQALLKSQRSFKLSEARMLLLNSDQIGFKTTYAAGYCFHSVLKRGKRWADFKPAHLPMVSTVKEAKKRDVKSPLAVIGAPDHIMDFYNNALTGAADNSVEDGDSDHE